jgi:hypothetical protein
MASQGFCQKNILWYDERRSPEHFLAKNALEADILSFFKVKLKSLIDLND